MLRREALLTEAVARFCIEFACFFLLAGRFSVGVAGKAQTIAAGYLIFLLLSYGLRPFFGLICDEYQRLHVQSAGCILVAVACLLPQNLCGPALFLAAIGSAAFHVGVGGEVLCFARGSFFRAGAVFSLGALGACLGTWAAQTNRFSNLYCALVCTVCALLCFLFSEARKYPKKIRAFRLSASSSLPSSAVLAVTLLLAFVLALVRSLIPAPRADGIFVWATAAAAAVGHLAGGILADRIGPRKTSLIGLIGALITFGLFTYEPIAYLIGTVLLFLPFSVSLGITTCTFPARPHFAFGLWSIALLAGAFPGFFIPHAGFSARIAAAVLLAACAVACGFSFTDYCKTIALLRRRTKKGGRV